MVKLPKEMQKRENSKPKRPQATKDERRATIWFKTNASPNATARS